MASRDTSAKLVCTAHSHHLGSHARPGGPALYVNSGNAVILSGSYTLLSWSFRLPVATRSLRMYQDPKPSRQLRRRCPAHRLPPKSSSLPSCPSLQQAWLASRVVPRRRGSYLMPGAQRPINETNIKLALTIARACLPDLSSTLWALHPVRTSLMMFLHVVRGFFPAFRGYSQAMIVDEVSRPRNRTAVLMRPYYRSFRHCYHPAVSRGLGF